jgi:ubiquitin-protein ligase
MASICKALTFKNKQCSRKAKTNGYCLQHHKIACEGGIIVANESTNESTISNANESAISNESAIESVVKPETEPGNIGASSATVVLNKKHNKKKKENFENFECLEFQPDESEELSESKILSLDSKGENKIYEDSIIPHVFGTMDIFSNGNHCYMKEISADNTTSACRSKRISQEIKFIKSNIPVHFNSTIAIRFDSTRPFIIKVIIFGPPETPYDSGCFEFDMYIPPEYPSIPPKMLITNTNGGKVRFGPNLYSNGKVCLSILGTWPGKSTSENWSKKTSNIWQVLISIQSAILGESEPYFLEPGYENLRKNKDAQTHKYTSSNGGLLYVRQSTIFCAMINQIRKPPVGFEELVRNHFKNKKDYIKSLMVQWIQDTCYFESELKTLKESISILEHELDNIK